MQLIESSNRHFHTLAKALSFTFIAAVVTFSLFVLMHKLIKSDLVQIDVDDPINVGNVVFEEEPTKTITRTPIKKIEPIKQPPRVDHNTAEPNDEIVFDSAYKPIDIIEVDVSTDFTQTVVDRDVRPIVRVPPRYPPEAASKGIEGWVRLSFSINEVGGVEDIEVIDSEPKRIFDKAAKRALSRWKYQPQIEEGQAIVRTGLSVMLEFGLEQQ